MTAAVIPFRDSHERAARAALARLTEPHQRALMQVRQVVLTLLDAAQNMRTHDPLSAASLEELADTTDDALCVLMGFTKFQVRDIPPENER